MTRKAMAMGAACAALAAAGTAVAASEGPTREAIDPVEAAVKPAALPTDLARAFDAFAEPAETAVPESVRVFAGTESVRKRFAPNPALARAIQPPARVGGLDWHLLPADGGVCLFVAVAGTCTSADEAATDGVWIIRFPKPEGKAVQGQVPGTGRHTLMGVLPAGVTGVAALTGVGDEAEASVSGDAYSVEVTKGYIKALRFTREDGSTYVGRFGR